MFAVPTGVIPSGDSQVVLFELQQLKASQNSMAQQLLSLSREIRKEITELRGLLPSNCSRNGAGEAPDLQLVRQVAPEAVQCLSWTCPVCGLTLSHKESFKGHIRKLVYPSKRPGCHMNSLIPQHQLLAHRFAGTNFYEQSYEFCKQFYHQVCVSCTKRDPDDVSLRHIWAWIDAARTDGADFPEYDTRCQMLSRKRSYSAARGSSQSSFASSSSGGSSSLPDQSSSPNL